MASPQLEKGYTKIAHEIIEAVARSAMTSMQLRVVFYIWRITYGFNRKVCDTNTLSFVTKVRSTKSAIESTLIELEKMQVIKITWIDEKKFSIGFNKDYERWKCFQ